MKNNNQSLWMEIQSPTFPSLDADMTADVCIVGAGIAGLTCAYALTKLGKSVIIIDQASIAKNETGRTTAHLTWVLDERYFHLEKMFGEENAKLALESHFHAIQYIEQVIRDEEIECDFERVDGYLFGSREELEKEYQAIQKMGMSINLGEKEPFGPYLQFPNQAQFHVVKYLRGLIKAILNQGGKIFCHTHAKKIEEKLITTQDDKKITAESVIVATCTPVNDRFYIHTKQAAYRTYVIAAAAPKESIPKGLYWDTSDPYHYVRLQKNLSDQSSEWLIVGGEDHKTGQGDHLESKFDALYDWAKKLFPMIQKVEHQWSGQVFEPIDSLAFIGKNPGDKHIYVITGHSGNGMTYGTIAGILIPDLIFGKKNSWEKLYDPSRKSLSAASKYIEENINTALQYADWLTPGELSEIEDLSTDHGIILREELKKIAVYKDKENKVHVNSAFCPHLGGCVRWNPVEKSWDCPCHGSRFTGSGEVLCRPTINNLTKKENL